MPKDLRRRVRALAASSHPAGPSLFARALGLAVAVHAACLAQEARQDLDPAFAHLGLWPTPPLGITQAILAATALAGLALAADRWPRRAALFGALGLAWHHGLDPALYLNHQHLLVLLCLLVAALGPTSGLTRRATLGTLAAVYAHAALAKLNADWLAGWPLAAWIADTFGETLPRPSTVSVARALAFGGLALDALVVPLLLWRRTRALATLTALVFHLANSQLFDIGVFPYLMLAATTLAWEPDWPTRLGLLRHTPTAPPPAPWQVAFVALWLPGMALFPLRHLLYPGPVAWNEDGHAFSWRMKLRDRQARARIWTVDPSTGSRQEIDLWAVLTGRQLSVALGNPTFWRRFAAQLRDEAAAEGHTVAVYATVWVSLNQRPAQLLFPPDTDLAALPDRPAWAAEGDWLLPFVDTPAGSGLPEPFPADAPP